MNARTVSFVLIMLTVTPGVLVTPAAAQDQTWLRQFGSTWNDHVLAMAPDGDGGAFVAGLTTGDLGRPNVGGWDAWIARYNAAGARMWIRQFGTEFGDYVFGLAPDGAGGVYLAGHTYGDLSAASAGEADVWLARYGGAGTRLWIRQFGSNRTDETFAIAAVANEGLFIAGATQGDLDIPNAGDRDVWLARYDENGGRQWIRQIGTLELDVANALCADGSGGAFVAGETEGDLGGENDSSRDTWFARYDAFGDQLWIQQLEGGGTDAANALAADGAGGFFIAGFASRSFGAPINHSVAWVARYDSAGVRAWMDTVQIGAVSFANALAVDDSGGVFAAGSTGDGDPGRDAWVGHYDERGLRTNTSRFGTDDIDFATALASDGEGGAYLAGITWGDLAGANIGMKDCWLALYSGTDARICTLTDFIVNRGVRLTGNLLSLLFSDPFAVAIASEQGAYFHVTEMTVRAISPFAVPTRLDLQTETRANAMVVQTRLSLFNVNTSMWDQVAAFAQPQTDLVTIIEDIPSPEHYVRASDGLIRIRVQMIRALSRGPFTMFVDHVQVTAYE